MKHCLPALAGTLALVLLAPPILAQTPPTGGVVDETLREPPRPPIPPADIPEITTPERVTSSVPPGGTPVPVRRFIVTGNTLLPDSELRGVLSRYEGLPHTLEEIYAIADYLTDLYRFYGYTLASVTVPAQRIDQGEVRLQVIEGRIGDIRVEGNERYLSHIIEQRVRSLRSGIAFRADDLQRELIRLNDLPGLTVRAVVRPGAEFGTSDIVLRVEEDTAEYRLTADNFGRDTIGEMRLTAEATFNSPLRSGDRLVVSGLVSEDSLLRFVRVAYGAPIGLSGDRLRFSFSRANYSVGGPTFGPLDIEGGNTNFRLEYLRPVVRTRATTLMLTAAVSRTKTDVDSLGQPIAESRLNLFEASAFFSTITDRGVGASVTGILGTNFRSNPLGTRDNAQRGRVRVDGTLSIPVAARTYLLVRGGAVYSPEPLADTQKFSLGGPWVMRGYQSSDARGDIGQYVSLEAQRVMRFGTNASSEATMGLFVEQGGVRRRALPGDPPGLDRSDLLQDWGVSFSMKPTSRFTLNASWARPFSNYPGSDGTTDSQTWVSLSAIF